MASKYIIAIGKKHFLNPAAISVAIVGFAARQYASWWIANIYLLPFVVVGSYFVIKKVRRLDLFASFFISTMFTSTIFCLASGQEVIPVLYKIIVYSPSLFFASIMLTEPMSLPPIKKLRIIYGAIVGILFVPQVHIGPFYFSPELALILGNIFVYLVSPDQKLILKLGNMIKITPDIYDFTFIPRNEMIFKPGQYMEITFDHPGQDSRGIRRYLTIASSPTEKEFRLGIKFYPRPSSFKKNLLKMDKNQYIVASQLAGDFTMPSDISKKLVFIAGGIGITPFRSMIKYMLDVNEKRDVHLLYLNKRIEDIAYKDIFDQAEKELELKTEYSIIGIPDNLYYKSLTEKIPDYKERVFYISGPSEMVSAFESNLVKSGVKKYNIRTDYFPGFA
jgi:ferredoxin-NADP reductase